MCAPISVDKTLLKLSPSVVPTMVAIAFFVHNKFVKITLSVRIYLSYTSGFIPLSTFFSIYYPFFSKNSITKNRIGLVTLLTITIAFIIFLFYEFNILGVDASMMVSVRWITAIVLVTNAFVRKNLTTWILTCLVLGVFVGLDFPDLAVSMHPLSQGFIKLVKTIVGPILFATLVFGIAGHSDLKSVGRMAWKSMLYFFCATTCAIFIGLALINLTEAGVGIDVANMPHEELPTTSAVSAADERALTHISENVHWLYKFNAFVRDTFPENIVKSVYENKVLQIVIFGVLFGIGLAMVNEKKRKPLVDFTESLSEAMFK